MNSKERLELLLVVNVFLFSSNVSALTGDEFEAEVGRLQGLSNFFISQTQNDPDLSEAQKFKDTKETLDLTQQELRRVAGDFLGMQVDWSELLGAAFLNDESFYGALSPGQTGSITFDFISPITELVVSGPEITSVVYEFIPDLGDFSQLSLLGTSFDESTNFGIDFTMSGFNQVIFATPLDSNGRPIIISGAEGQNISKGILAIGANIPEPSSIAILVLGLILLYLNKTKIVAAKALKLKTIHLGR